jgi:hypothetical protein
MDDQPCTHNLDGDRLSGTTLENNFWVQILDMHPHQLGEMSPRFLLLHERPRKVATARLGALTSALSVVNGLSVFTTTKFLHVGEQRLARRQTHRFRIKLQLWLEYCEMSRVFATV